MKGPVKAEKRTDGFWYLVDKDGFCLAEIKGPPSSQHEEIANQIIRGHYLVKLENIALAAQNYRTARINSFDKPLHISAVRAKLWDALDEI